MNYISVENYLSYSLLAVIYGFNSNTFIQKSPNCCNYTDSLIMGNSQKKLAQTKPRTIQLVRPNLKHMVRLWLLKWKYQELWFQINDVSTYSRICPFFRCRRPSSPMEIEPISVLGGRTVLFFIVISDKIVFITFKTVLYLPH